MEGFKNIKPYNAIEWRNTNLNLNLDRNKNKDIIFWLDEKRQKNFLENFILKNINSENFDFENLNIKKAVNKPEDLKSAIDLFSYWSSLLNDSDAIANLYTKDCSFLPTKNGNHKIKPTEYFKHFCTLKPVGTISKDEDDNLKHNVIKIGPWLIHTGFYEFKLNGNGYEKIKARFTFVWEKRRGGEWKIRHHHSSEVPKDK